CGIGAQATVSFVYSSSNPYFASLGLYDDYSGVLPMNTGQGSFVSNSITYSAITADVGSWQGSVLASVLGSTDIPNFLVTANGDENFLVTPGFAVHRMGFETYTINEVGNPLSVAGAPNIVVKVMTSAGTTTLSMNAPTNNHGFLGIISDDAILGMSWYGQLGGVRDTGITNMRISGTVPEPSAIVALGLGAVSLLMRRRKL
ncbi:MAG: PEP-CTERM sorting domain-containing protein, partial [Armatimonadetes bacterium]|nr:PEP-CTERM sorting domain-containing protein [Armatimonadota bacterium]